MAECLVAGGYKRVDVVTPYVEVTNERLKQFLRTFGIEVDRLRLFNGSQKGQRGIDPIEGHS